MEMRSNSKEIENLGTVSVSPLPFMSGLNLKRRLLSHATRWVKKVTGGSGSLESLTSGDFDMAVIGELLEQIISDLSEKELKSLINDLTFGMMVENQNVNEESVRDIVFAGNHGEFWQCIIFALEVNFGSFLDLVKPTLMKLFEGEEETETSGKN